jgi:hypothetical protein
MYIFNYEIYGLVVFYDITVFVSLIMQIRILYFFHGLKTSVELSVSTEKDSVERHSKQFFQDISLHQNQSIEQ